MNTIHTFLCQGKCKKCCSNASHQVFTDSTWSPSRRHTFFSSCLTHHCFLSNLLPLLPLLPLPFPLPLQFPLFLPNSSPRSPSSLLFLISLSSPLVSTSLPTISLSSPLVSTSLCLPPLNTRTQRHQVCHICSGHDHMSSRCPSLFCTYCFQKQHRGQVSIIHKK